MEVTTSNKPFSRTPKGNKYNVEVDRNFNNIPEFKLTLIYT